MEDILLELLKKLEAIGEKHEELFDSDVRQRMSNAVLDAFVRQSSAVPEDFGLYSSEANSEVHAALEHYVSEANARASVLGLSRFADRLAALQNRLVRTPGQKNDFDDFFGYSPPEAFDEAGRVIRKR